MKVIYIDSAPYVRYPFISVFILFFQYTLLRLGCIQKVWLSNQLRHLNIQTVSLINQKFETVVCRSQDIGYLLKLITIPIVLDIKSSDQITISTTEDYQNLLWSLFFCKYISEPTIHSLNTFFSIRIPHTLYEGYQKNEVS